MLVRGITALTTRFYIFPDDSEPVRLSNTLVDGLYHGRDCLPQFAGTGQRILVAFLEFENSKPQRISRIEGSIWKFDFEGSIQQGRREAFALMMESLPTPQQTGTVVALQPRTERKRLEQEFSWEPGESEIDRVVADIWPKKKADRLELLTSSTKRKPPLTYDARRALDIVTKNFWKIPYEIERLKEPSLKSFLAEARERSDEDLDFSHLYRALADMAEWQLEVTRRRRSGKGVWYALIEIVVITDEKSETVAQYYERCSGRKDAVKAARHLLAQHAEKLDETTRVEAEVMTDLEWERRPHVA